MVGGREPKAADPALQRLDGFPYIHRVRDIMAAPVATAHADATLQETVTRLQNQRIGSCVVVDDQGTAIGIVTERDVLNAVGRFGGEALAKPLRSFMSAPVESIEADALLYRAIARMDRRRIRHLAALDEAGKPIGMVTARSVLRLRAGQSLAIGDAVETAADSAALRAAHEKLPELARALLREGIAAPDISAVLSAITRDIAARAAQLAEQAMNGAAPAPWCLLVLGSAGRGESLLAPDQDNALIVADAGAAEIDGWFLAFAEKINVILDAAGIPFCKGNVMARNRAWRRTAGEWRDTVDGWTQHPNPEALLNVDIFFDAAPVAGDRSLARELMAYAHASAEHALPFLRLLAEAGTNHRPPLGLFGGLTRDREGRTDLKLGGLLPIVSAARVMALKLGTDALPTGARLQAAIAAGRLGGDNGEGLEQARRAIAAAILRQQVADLSDGRAAGNRVDARLLSRAQRSELRAALRSAGEAATLVQDVLTS
jgi:CBS domain-containing protein